MAIALDSMTQATGSFSPGLPSHLTFFFRISPVVCLMESLTTLAYFVYLMVVTRDLKSASRLTANSYSEDFGSDLSTDVIGGSSLLKRVRENGFLRALVFSLGSLP